MPLTTIKFEGKSIEDALEKASKELNIPPENIKYKVIERKKKLFGEKVIIQVESMKELQDFFDEIYNLANEFFNIYFNYLGIDGKVYYPILKENYSFIRIETENDKFFISRQAKVLIATQTILNSIGRKKLGFDPRIVLDCGEFRIRRDNFLKEIARKKAEEVKKSGRVFVFKPLEPYERKIIHLTLQDDPDVYTKSEGNNKYKRLKIIPKDKEINNEN